MVIAESVSVAKDAAERVRVDFEPLPAVTDTVAAAAAHAPRLWDEAASNVCIDADVGDAAATAAAFARAAHVAKLDTWIQRVTGVPLEPRAAVGSYDAASGRTTLYAGSGGVVRQKHELAGVLGVPPQTAFGWCPATSAAISAPATRSIPSSRWWPGRRDASAARSNGPASVRKPSSATTRAAICSSAPSLRSTTTAGSWRCGDRSSAMSARTPCRSCR